MTTYYHSLPANHDGYTSSVAEETWQLPVSVDLVYSPQSSAWAHPPSSLPLSPFCWEFMVSFVFVFVLSVFGAFSVTYFTWLLTLIYITNPFN
jgi:hypothetical protein